MDIFAMRVYNWMLSSYIYGNIHKILNTTIDATSPYGKTG